MPNYERIIIFSEDLVAVHMQKTKINFNKPIYLGMCILDLSKTLMYDFHYNYIKKKYQSKAKLLMTDTDSLMYEIHTEDFSKIGKEMKRNEMIEGDEEKKCKGVKKGVVKNNILFDDYKNCLFNDKEQRRTINAIRSWQHEIFTETVNKIALSANDDKQISLPDRINTHAWGYLSKK